MLKSAIVNAKSLISPSSKQEGRGDGLAGPLSRQRGDIKALPISGDNLETIPTKNDISTVCDISDLIYYIGHHEHLTGIQRVQASIVQDFLTRDAGIRYIAFNATLKTFHIIEADVLSLVLSDLALPLESRTFDYSKEDAKSGLLPMSRPVAYADVPANACILLLGAAWVIQDYFRHINQLKTDTGARFACLIHDLIPVYARETCDQGTARVFRSFLATSRHSTDHYICVSENTKRDLLRHFRENGWSTPSTSVVPHATTLTAQPLPQRPKWFSDDPSGFVLIVSTIEGRKNHNLLLRVWERLVQEHGDGTPKLICIGRPGWRSEEFLLRYVSSQGLNGKVEIQSDVADKELEYLYRECLFTVYPSLYEGWGLPISESLSYGKLCVCSNTSSMPEAGGDLVRYINPYDFEGMYEVMNRLIVDRGLIHQAEQKIAEEFVPRSWADVAVGYLDALSEVPEQQDHLPSIPGHFVFRMIKYDFEGMLGQHLLEGVIDYLRSDLKSDALSIASFEAGHLSRGPGDWNYLEEWGCWLGLNGGSINFNADDEAEYCAYASYQVLSPFLHERVRIVSNGVTTFHIASYNGAAGVMPFNFKARRGKNTINISVAVSAQQREDALKIDNRGLTIGLKEVVFLRRHDTIGRLDIMPAISRL